MTVHSGTSNSTHECVLSSRRGWATRHPYISLLLVGLCSLMLIGTAAMLGAM